MNPVLAPKLLALLFAGGAALGPLAVLPFPPSVSPAQPAADLSGLEHRLGAIAEKALVLAKHARDLEKAADVNAGHALERVAADADDLAHQARDAGRDAAQSARDVLVAQAAALEGKVRLLVRDAQEALVAAQDTVRGDVALLEREAAALQQRVNEMVQATFTGVGELFQQVVATSKDARKKAGATVGDARNAAAEAGQLAEKAAGDATELGQDTADDGQRAADDAASLGRHAARDGAERGWEETREARHTVREQGGFAGQAADQAASDAYDFVQDHI